MKILNNILRNALPVFATAAIMSLSLTSCGLDSESQQQPSKSIVKEVALKTTPSMNEILDNHVALMEDGEKAMAPEATTEEAPATSEISVLKAEACLDIENHEPIASGSEFSCRDDKVWIYSKVKMEKGSKGFIKHVYFLNGREIQSIELKVKGPTFRTRSYKTMNESMGGNWKVEVQDEAGKLLDTVEFYVGDEEGGC